MKRDVGILTESASRVTIVQALRESITSRPFLLAALALYWSWVNMAIQSPLFFPTIQLSGGLLVPTWMGTILVCCLVYFVLGMWFKTSSKLAQNTWYLKLISILMTTGAIISYAWAAFLNCSLETILGFVLYGIGSLGIGAGTSCLLVEWGRIFGYLGPKEVLYHGIVAMLISAAFLAALSLAPDYLGRLVLVLIPFPLYACLSLATKNMPKRFLYDQGLNAETYVPWKFLFTALLHGLALGVLMGASLTNESGMSESLTSAISFIIAAFLLLLTSVFIKMDFNHLIYQIGFPLMATGALLVACSHNLWITGRIVQLIGFCYVHLIMWGLCSYMTKRFSLSAAWVVSWPTCCLMLGQGIGGIAGCTVITTSDAQGVHIMSMIVSFSLLMAALLMMSNRNLTTGWGIAIPANGVRDISSSSLTNQAVFTMAAESGLTPRERDTFALLARGHNRRTISEELTISEETVKSHVSNVYRKMGIHSQQELIDLVEEKRKGLYSEQESVLE